MNIKMLAIKETLAGNWIPDLEKLNILAGKGSHQAYTATTNGLKNSAADAAKKKAAELKAAADAAKALADAEVKRAKAQALSDSKAMVGKSVKEMQNQIAAYRKLRAAGVDANTALELSSNSAFAEYIKGAKITNNMKKEMEAYTQAVREWKIVQEAGLDNGEALIANLNRKRSLIDLQEKLLEMKYTETIANENDALAAQNNAYNLVQIAIEKVNTEKIRSIQDQVDENSYLMDMMVTKEDAINKKYDDQEKVLSNIQKINQDIVSLQKSRVSLADALSRGDISAAAQSIVELRGQNASSSLGEQGETLSAARKQELAALGRVDLETKNKALQLDILKIQHDQILPLEQQSRAIQDMMNTSKNYIASMEEETRLAIQKNNLQFLKDFGMTKTAIENTLSALDLAKNAGVDITKTTFLTNILNASLGSTNDIAKAMDTVKSSVIATMKEIATMRASMGLDALVKADDSVINLAIKAFEIKLKATQDALDALTALYNALILKNTTGGGSDKPKVETKPEVETKPRPGSAWISDGNGGWVKPNKPAGDYGWDDNQGWVKGYYKDEANIPQPTPILTATPPPQGPCGPGLPYYNYYTGTCVATAAEIRPSGASSSSSSSGSNGSGGGKFGLQMLARGGVVPKFFAAGGFARGTDTVPAMLTPGEFIMRKKAVENFGVQNLQNINEGSNSSGTVYNYNLKVHLDGSNLDVNDVATAVMGKIRQVESQRIRG
jgi:hypothetical protein